MSYNLNNRIDWKSFKKLPLDLQTEYISNLQKQYGATATDIARMFGICLRTMLHHVKNHALDVNFSHGRRMSAGQRDAWERYLDGETRKESIKPVNTENSTAHKSEDTCLDGIALEPTTPGFYSASTTSMIIASVSLCFCGTIDIDAIANSLRVILGKEATGKVEIICNLT